MHPQPPKRSDSAKYVSTNLSETYTHSQGSLDESRLSFGQLNFVVEPAEPTQQKMTPALTGIVPPLSSYSPDASPAKGRIATGYVSKSFESHSRHPNGNTSMVYVNNYSNNLTAQPLISPLRKNSLKVHSKEDMVNFKTEGEFSIPKKEGYVSLERSSEYSVNDFMAKLLSLDSEFNADTMESKNRNFSRYQPSSPIDDFNQDSLHDLLKVTLLENEDVSQRNFYMPKSFDFDPELKDMKKRTVLDATKQSMSLNHNVNKDSMEEMHDLLEINLLGTKEIPKTNFNPPASMGFDPALGDPNSTRVPKRTSSKYFIKTKQPRKLQTNDILLQKTVPQNPHILKNSTHIELKDLPITPEKSFADDSDTAVTESVMSSAVSVRSLEDSPAEVDEYPINMSTDAASVISMSNFDKKSNSTVSSSSSSALSIAGVEKPTFQTLRRNRDVAEGTVLKPSEESFEAMKASAKKSSNPQVQFDFAKFCIQVGDPFADTGVLYLQKLAKSGFSDAQFVLGQAYVDDGRYDIALRYFAAATKRNHYQASYEAGYLCEHGGFGLKKNEREALNYYTKAGTSGHKKAMYRLALAELYGQLGLKRNINNGMKWLNRGEAVADEDCPEPLYELSLIYEVGIYPIILSDAEHSFSLLKEAADLNHPPAIYKLGYCYEYGYLGVETEIPKSITLYQISANAGNKEAQLAFSGWLLSGYNSVIVKNEREAFYWAHLSALQGLARAEYTMGYLLESGIGVNMNISEAIKWYKLAARQGDEMALKRLSEIGQSPKSPRKSNSDFMKEYSKLVQKENILTQELHNISNRLQLPSLLSDDKLPSSQLKTDLTELKDIIHGRNIQLIKEKIHEFEGKLSQEKLMLTCKLQDLAMEFVNSTAQVDKLQEIIQNHSASQNTYYIPTKEKVASKKLKEEEEYLDFTRKHGTTGGWDSVNHSTFVSLRHKYSNDMGTFYKICVDRIPGMLISDIQNHEEWYRTYSRLLQNRKKKIQEWKKSREIEAEKMIKDLETDQEDLKVQSEETEKQIKKRLEIKKALQEWKNSKSSHEIVAPLQETKDNSKEIEKRKKIKEKVQAYVGRKSQIQALEKELTAVSQELEKKEKDSRYAITNEKFKKKDHDFLEKRMEIIHKKKKEEIMREKRLQILVSKVAIHVTRDPKRLMQPTIAQRMKATTPDDESEKVKSKFEAPSIPKRYLLSVTLDIFQPGEQSCNAGNLLGHVIRS